MVDLPRPAGDVLVSNPQIADAVLRTSTRLYLIGVELGQASVFLFDSAGGQIASFNIYVEADLSSLNQLLAEAIPDGYVRAEAMQGSIVLRGAGASATDASRAVEITQEHDRALAPVDHLFDQHRHGGSRDEQLFDEHLCGGFRPRDHQPPHHHRRGAGGPEGDDRRSAALRVQAARASTSAAPTASDNLTVGNRGSPAPLPVGLSPLGRLRQRRRGRSYLLERRLQHSGDVAGA